MLQRDRRFDMLGQLYRIIAIGGEAGEQLGQQSELVAREHSEQRVVDRTLIGGEPRQSADTLIGDRELYSATVAWMRALEIGVPTVFDMSGPDRSGVAERESATALFPSLVSDRSNRQQNNE
jgi:hypothetical protein